MLLSVLDDSPDCVSSVAADHALGLVENIRLRRGTPVEERYSRKGHNQERRQRQNHIKCQGRSQPRSVVIIPIGKRPLKDGEQTARLHSAYLFSCDGPQGAWSRKVSER